MEEIQLQTQSGKGEKFKYKGVVFAISFVCVFRFVHLGNREKTFPENDFGEKSNRNTLGFSEVEN